MSDRLLQETHRTIKLGEIEYNLAPVNLNILSDIEDEFNCGLGELSKAFEKKNASTLRTLLWIFIKNNGINLEITREDIGAEIALGDIATIAEQIGELITNSMKE